METMAVVQYNSGMPLSKVHYAGDLSWVQKKVLQFRQPDNRYNKTVISHQYEISDIVENYHSREYMAELKNGYYTPQFGSGTRLRIAANIRYAEAVVEYAPGFWNVIKWAWIQYASILVIFFYVIETVKNFAFSNRLVPNSSILFQLLNILTARWIVRRQIGHLLVLLTTALVHA